MSEDFKNRVLEQFFEDLTQSVTNNYSHERFGTDGVDRSMIFDVKKHSMYLEWFLKNVEAIHQTYRRFADDASRDLYFDIIRYRLAGHLHVKIGLQTPDLTERQRLFNERFVPQSSTIATTGMFGALKHYDAVWDDTRYTVDCLEHSLGMYLVNRQYLFERGGVAIKPEPGDHVIDGGSFSGETAVVFSRAVGPGGRVYAFDPVQNHLDIGEHNFSRAGYENVTAFGYGLSDTSIEAPTVVLENYSPGWRVNGTVPLCRIDDLVIDGRIQRVDFIKLDIEGSEHAALRGALASIHAFKPKLAISVYHKPDDLFAICATIEALGLGYAFYLDHHTIWDEETVLYATST